jgi:mRNA-degrading endonuclease RelE of RelBE toxin-antitoxin system
MNWVCNLSKDAIKQLGKIPKTYQGQLANAIDEMEVNPFAGDVCPIKSGEFKGGFRKRVGKYRIIFSADTDTKTAFVFAIVRRSDTTY